MYSAFARIAEMKSEVYSKVYRNPQSIDIATFQFSPILLSRTKNTDQIFWSVFFYVKAIPHNVVLPYYAY